MVMGFDYGSNNIGIALGLSSSSLEPLRVISNTSKSSVLHQVDRLIEIYCPVCLVVGTSTGARPLQQAYDFGLSVRNHCSTPLFWVNEGLSSFKEANDSFSALLILSSFFRLIEWA